MKITINSVRMMVPLSIAICGLFYSCSKGTNNSPPAKAILGIIQYKVNGELVIVNNKNIESGEFILLSKQLKDNYLFQTRYLLKAEKAVNNAFLFSVVSDSLQQTNYHYDSAGVNNQPTGFALAIAYKAQESEIVYSEDYFDINITAYKSTRISGTFSAKLTPEKNLFDYNNRGTTLITEGTFNEIPITY